MKKNYTIDYLSYILFKAIGAPIRVLPLGFILFLGRRTGDLFYYFDYKHRALAYSNIRRAFGDELGPAELSRFTKKFYQAFGQNMIEMFLIPLVDEDYFKRYISFEGLNNIEEGFKKGKGVILAAVHAGSWELSNIICANLGFPFILFVRGQRFSRLNALLNSYRIQKGCRVIQRENQTRSLITTLKNNESIGITIDQGGAGGTQVKFFGKDASMAVGAIKLALKYDSAIIPAFYTRINGPQIKIIIEPPFAIKKTDNEKEDIRENLQRLAGIFEKYIRRYPQEYLWTYKTWKYSDERKILILHDGKAGHIRQSEAAANIAEGLLQGKGIKTETASLEVKFKSKFARLALTFSACLAGRYACQGCLGCLKKCLEEESYNNLIHQKVDIVISCGSTLPLVNYFTARENLAKSIVILRPSPLSLKKFDLVIMPKHDNPPRRKNIVSINGALNLINEKYLHEQSSRLKERLALNYKPSVGYIGFLIGGDTKRFYLQKDLISKVIRQLKGAAEKTNFDILLTTSRRTSKEVEDLIRKEFRDSSRCKMMVIANEKNIPEAVGGILGLSRIVVASPESISMISEAANSSKYVLVFRAPGLGQRHKIFLSNLQENKFIYLEEPEFLGKRIEEVLQEEPPIRALSDNSLVREAIRKIL